LWAAGFAFVAAADDRKPPAATDFDLQGFLDAQFRAGQQRVVVPPGRYRVTPKQGRHLFFKDLADITILAGGVEMTCTQTVRAIGFENCRNVRFQGLTIDYDPLPIAEARITALTPDKSSIEFQIIPGYPDNQLAERIEIYDPATGELRRTDAPWSKQFESLGNHRYRIAKRPGYRYDAHIDTEQVGDILVTINQFPAGAGGHAITAERCTGLKLEDITLYSAPTFGFVEHDCDATTYLRCKIDRRAPAADPVQRAFPRMRSLTADAFHSIGALRGPAIVDCTAKFQGDDCVNIHGTYHLVTASQGRELRIAAVGQLTIEPGDPVEFLPRDGRRPPDAVAKQLTPDGPLTAAERAFLEKLSLYPRHKERLLGGQARFFRLTLDREVPLAMGSAVCSGNRVGNGFAVKRCDFGYNRSRGILIKASRGEVTGNTITHGWMAAVLVAPEFWWFESASSSDLLIAGNKIVGCRRPAIEVIAPGGNGKPLPSGAHRNIAIQDNTITGSVWPNIYVTSTDGLVIRNNQLTRAEPDHMVPPPTRGWNWEKETPRPIVTLLCDRPQVQRPAAKP
jgi:hypothetical protein